MPKRDQRFKALDQMPTPDLWPEIVRQSSSAPASSPRVSRVPSIVAALAIAAAGVWVAVQAFGGQDGRRVDPSGQGPSIAQNTMIAYVSDRGGDPEIYVMDLDGMMIRQLSDNEVEDTHPSWGPNGKLATASVRSTSEDRLQLYLFDQSGEPTALETEAGHITSPTWSPDGSRIAFSGCCEVGTQIYVINADGTQERQLTDLPDDGVSGAYEPSWSPDGTRLALTINEYDPRTQDENEVMYIMNDDGTGLVRVTSPADLASEPAWSPDGRRIAFTSRGDGNSEIYVMNADGSGQTNLTRSDSDEGDPAWSPDGSRILFASNADGNVDLYIMDADGSDLTRITSTPWNEWEPDWA
jgi:Tol biopolymer transport system component